MTRKSKLIIFIFGLIAFVFIANFSFAQDLGLEFVDDSLNGILGNSGSDPRVIIAKIIQIALGFLAITALILILYTGFLWMTSNGEEDKISKAKRILKNAIIGLVIILSAWTITTYVISRITGSFSSALNPVNFSGPPRIFTNPGLSALGSCSVENVYPENNQKDVPRNTSVIINFKEELSSNGLCVLSSGKTCSCGEEVAGESCKLINPKIIRIYKTDLEDACNDDSCPKVNSNITEVNLLINSDNKTLILTPISYLGDPAENIDYSVKFTNGLKKTDGSSMFASCLNNYISWHFEVSSRLDLTPPQVVYNKIFPRPDNEKDLQYQINSAQAAKSSLEVMSCLNTYSSSKIISVIPETYSPSASASPLNYQGELTKFKVIIPADSKDKALLFDGNNINLSLGSADFDFQGNARFDSYFVFKATEREVGDSWTITLAPEILADTLTLGDKTYIFANSYGGNNILVPAGCNSASQAEAIQAVLSGHDLVGNIERVNSNIKITAKLAGSSGNYINLNSSNQAALQIQAFKGGVDKKMFAQKKDKEDRPMNTVIQLNFDEPINPLKIAGLASEVAEYIRVVNYDISAGLNGATCTNDSDCKSYNCTDNTENNTCVGDYLPGKFLVSNAFKTVEFISNKECGVNGCGEKIYCLPASSHLTVEMKSADLVSCNTDADCLTVTPFGKCADTSLGYKTCQNESDKNYPTAQPLLNGIVDLAANSFDGNRNNYADGPLDYYNDNYLFQDELNDNKWDNYRFSFYVSDQMNLTPPRIEMINPGQNSQTDKLSGDIKITWNTLMMNNTLKTGSSLVNNGKNIVEHKLINLKSLSPSGLGFWITNDNFDTDNDGEPDKTTSWIKHSTFSEATTYKAQVGSGVKDIYQNCFKPSDGDGCIGVSLENPSCCFGQATNILGVDGNCQ